MKVTPLVAQIFILFRRPSFSRFNDHFGTAPLVSHRARQVGLLEVLLRAIYSTARISERDSETPRSTRGLLVQVQISLNYEPSGLPPEPIVCQKAAPIINGRGFRALRND
jgi:hypothetical protein